MISLTSRFSRLGIALVIASICCSLSATEPTARSFRIFTIIEDINGLKYDASARETIELSISQRPQTAFPIPSDNHLVIYKEVLPPKGSPEGTPPTKIIQADTYLPADAPRVLVAMLPQSTGGLTATIIADDPGKHLAGQLRLINLSRFKAALGLNHDLHNLSPGEDTLMDWNKTGGILVQVASQKDGQWTSVLRQERRAPKWARSYCFVFDYTPDPNQFLPDPTNPPPATVRFFSENVVATSPSP